ncbi:hypothetical protein J0A71_07g14660 [Encephalitozoon cuniculi]|nr:hypothetical protein J0A71_07g14660 [Encephalitozoon cuniculi]
MVGIHKNKRGESVICYLSDVQVHGLFLRSSEWVYRLWINMMGVASIS